MYIVSSSNDMWNRFTRVEYYTGEISNIETNPMEITINAVPVLNHLGMKDILSHAIRNYLMGIHKHQSSY